MDIDGNGAQQGEKHADVGQYDMSVAEGSRADAAMSSPLAAAALLAVSAAFCTAEDGTSNCLGSGNGTGEPHLPDAAALAEAGGGAPDTGLACMQPEQQQPFAGSPAAPQRPRARSLPPRQKQLRKSSRVRPASSAPHAPGMQQQQPRAGSRSEAQAAGEGAAHGFVLVAKALTKSDTNGRVILPRVMVETNLPFLMGYRCCLVTPKAAALTAHPCCKAACSSIRCMHRLKSPWLFPHCSCLYCCSCRAPSTQRYKCQSAACGRLAHPYPHMLAHVPCCQHCLTRQLL